MGFFGGPRVPKLVVEPTPLKNMRSRQFGSSLQVSGENNQRFETTNLDMHNSGSIHQLPQSDLFFPRMDVRSSAL